MAIDRSFLEALGDLLGPQGVLTDPAAIAPFNREQRGRFQGAARLVACPADTAQCAAVVGLCRTAGVAVVPQGGNTGHVGGAVANADQLIVSTARLNKVRWIDADGFRMAVDAGCVLADVQAAAREAGRLFPLTLGSEGTCQIGGNLASNAGGLNVIRYGSVRSLCLGLEVVLPDGRVWNGMRALEKDNAGYALRQLFIGSEGTLGLITGAVVKLFPLPSETVTALCALSDVDAVVPFLARARALTGDEVSAFELISGFAFDLAVEHLQGVCAPMDRRYPWYVLLELSTSRVPANMDETLAIVLDAAFEEGLINDAVVAGSEARRAMLWRMREGIPEAQTAEGASIKHDIGVPIAAIPAFLKRALSAVEARMPGIRPCPFGHVGDGNIHFNLTQPKDMDRAAFLDHWAEMNQLVHDIVQDMGGTFSAEHGVGRLKATELGRRLSPEEVDLMRAIKTAIDPIGLMNPGALFPS